MLKAALLAGEGDKVLFEFFSQKSGEPVLYGRSD